MIPTDAQKLAGQDLAEKMIGRAIPLDEFAALLAEKPDLRQYDYHGRRTALSWAARYDHDAHIKLMLDAGADITQVDLDGYTALQTAIYYCRSCVKTLISRGAPIDQCDRDGNTPLMTAAYKNNLSAIQMILAINSDVTAKNKKGQTALDVAIKSNNMAAAEVIRYMTPEEKHKRYVASGMPLPAELAARRPQLRRMGIAR